jgi:hypothetical protein
MYPPEHQQIVLSALFECVVVPHPLVMGRARAFKALRYEQVPAEDYDMWARAIVGGYRFANLEIPLFRYTMPSYSEEKTMRLVDDVRRIIAFLLVRQFGMDAADAAELAPAFSLREKAVLSQSQARELLGRFRARLADMGWGFASFRECAVRYAPHLVSALDALDAARLACGENYGGSVTRTVS